MTGKRKNKGQNKGWFVKAEPKRARCDGDQEPQETSTSRPLSSKMASNEMATSQKPTEHFQTCTLCTEVFVNPCTLVCNHTFCRNCVVNYTKTRPEAISAKSLICPFCSKLTKVPEPERPVEALENDVKPVVVLQELGGSFNPESKGQSDDDDDDDEPEPEPESTVEELADVKPCSVMLEPVDLPGSEPSGQSDDDDEPEPESPVEESADVKPCNVILEPVDSPDSEPSDTTNCAYCKGRGETTPAAVWCRACDDALCEKCVRVHSRFPSTHYHDVTNLYGEIQKRRKAMCNIHERYCIELVCKDCKKTICRKCRILYHNECDSVVRIESDLFTMLTELIKKKEALSKRQEDLKPKTDELKSTLSREACRYAQMEEDIMLVTQNAIEQIKSNERKLLDELKEMSNKHIGQLREQIKSKELKAHMCQIHAKVIDQALQSECDSEVYEVYLRCGAEEVEAPREMEVTERGRIAKITFHHDIKRLKQEVRDLKMGELEVLYEGVVNLEDNPLLLDTIDVQVAGARNKGWVADVTVLIVDGMNTVIVTDRINNKLSSFYTRNNKHCRSRLCLSSAPWSLTKLTNKPLLAVTVPGMKQIITVKVTPDLELVSTIKTNKQYWGITYLTPYTVAVGSKSPPCVDIVDMCGNVLFSFNPLLSCKRTLQCPNYLCTTRKGNILVSDGATKCVVCLTPRGKVVFTYRPAGDNALKCPQGITSTCTGDILVTDFSLNCVIHLNESGEFVRNILTKEDGIEKPLGVDVDGRSRIYVSLQFQEVVKVYLC
ncbi:uncharacterized protein LOC124138892 isoform X2 [Haliotis rufescens]|uniref:uncharacterized protein LOC124138892 isoform X2 n=1 Tax=Haliotis rufescens TaxID=6454 RepID=UPI001EB08649|nr:uncharacterized protein LOC124138892 isoform X2 [Haliotis rufescens]